MPFGGVILGDSNLTKVRVVMPGSPIVSLVILVVFGLAAGIISGGCIFGSGRKGSTGLSHYVARAVFRTGWK